MENIKQIPLGNGKFALVDADLYPSLVKYKWRAVKGKTSFYAKTTIHSKKYSFDISMHRLIAQTKSPMVCHHKNFNTLDNRRVNLENMTKDAHNRLHKMNTVRILRKAGYEFTDPEFAI